MFVLPQQSFLNAVNNRRRTSAWDADICGRGIMFLWMTDQENRAAAWGFTKLTKTQSAGWFGISASWNEKKNMWIYDVVEEKIHGTNDEVFLETKLMATNRDRLRYSSETAPLFQLDWSLHLRWRQECKRYGSQWDRWGLTGSR